MRRAFAWIAALFVSTPAFATYIALPGYTDSQGREWIDMSAAAWREWGEIAAHCDPTTGGCNGVLPVSHNIQNPTPGEWGMTPFDLTGFTWASGAEVSSMLFEVGNAVWDHFSYSCCTIGSDGTTFSILTNGFTREGQVVMMTYTSGGQPVPIYQHDLFAVDVIGTPGQIPTNPNFSDPSIGGWFYRNTVAVPEPGSLALFGVGLLGVLVGSKRRKRAA